MAFSSRSILGAFSLGILTVGPAFSQDYNVFNQHPDTTRTGDGKWQMHDESRPAPPKAAPKSEAELAQSARAPKDAKIIFDGKNLDQFDQLIAYVVKDGAVEIQPGRNELVTREAFGSGRLHLEWAAPAQSDRSGQDRANSGIFLMSAYEVQVLDTYENKTYADGMAGALYGVKPPDANPLRPSGQWQYYDIWFQRPTFDGDKMVTPAAVTVYINGIPVQNNMPFDGPSGYKKRDPYRPHPDKLPLRLQYHNETLKFRNIWFEPMEDGKVKSPEGVVGVAKP